MPKKIVSLNNESSPFLILSNEYIFEIVKNINFDPINKILGPLFNDKKNTIRKMVIIPTEHLVEKLQVNLDEILCYLQMSQQSRLIIGLEQNSKNDQGTEQDFFGILKSELIKEGYQEIFYIDNEVLIDRSEYLLCLCQLSEQYSRLNDLPNNQFSFQEKLNLLLSTKSYELLIDKNHYSFEKVFKDLMGHSTINYNNIIEGFCVRLLDEVTNIQAFSRSIAMLANAIRLNVDILIMGSAHMLHLLPLIEEVVELSSSLFLKHPLRNLYINNPINKLNSYLATQEAKWPIYSLESMNIARSLLGLGNRSEKMGKSR